MRYLRATALKRLGTIILSTCLTMGAGLLPVTPVLFVAGVAVTQSACDSNKIREARKAAFRIQVVTDAAVDTTASLFERGIITPAQTKKIAQALLSVNHSNRILIDKAAEMKEDSPANRAALIQTVRQISDAIKELKATGVLGIKNPDNSLAFDSTVAALDTALAAIEIALGGK